MFVILTFSNLAVTMLIIMSVQGNRLLSKMQWRVWFTRHLSSDWTVSTH